MGDAADGEPRALLGVGGWKTVGLACLAAVVAITCIVLSSPDGTRAWGVDVVTALQRDADAKAALSLPSILGDHVAILVVFAIATFGVDFRFGLAVVLFVLAGMVAVLVLKDAAHQPRPGWISPKVEARCSGEYAFPSGHAADAVTLYGMVAARAVAGLGSPAQRAGVVAAWVVAFVAVGVSRIARGVHFPDHVIVGWLCGLGALAASQVVLAVHGQQFWKTLALSWTWPTALKSSAALTAPLLALHWAVVGINAAYWTVPEDWLASRASLPCSRALLPVELSCMASSLEAIAVLAVLPLAAYHGTVACPMVYPRDATKAVLRVAVAVALGGGVIVGVGAAVPDTAPAGVVVVCKFVLRGVLLAGVGLVGGAWVCGRLGLVVEDRLVA